MIAYVLSPNVLDLAQENRRLLKRGNIKQDTERKNLALPLLYYPLHPSMTPEALLAPRVLDEGTSRILVVSFGSLVTLLSMIAILFYMLPSRRSLQSDRRWLLEDVDDLTTSTVNASRHRRHLPPIDFTHRVNE